MTGFVHKVHQFFDPLALRYGLGCIVSTSTKVRYGNERVFMQIMFAETGSFEIGVEIGQIQNSVALPERPFDLSEILGMYESPDVAFVEFLQASEPGILPRTIKRLADLTQKYADKLLRGEATEFLLLGRFRDKECAEYAVSRDLRYARADVEKAWRDRDYFAVVKAFKPWASKLTPAERKRLEFAEKKLGKL